MSAHKKFTSIRTKELRAITAAIDRLPKKIDYKERRKILRKGLKPMVRAMKSKAPSKTGQLKLAIGTKTYRNNKGYVFAGPLLNKRISATIGGQKFKDNLDAFYAQWLEFGFRAIAFPEKGEQIGRGKKPINPNSPRITNIPPRPFIRPAVDASKGSVVRTIAIETHKVFKRIAKELRR